MEIVGSRRVYAAADLVDFIACRHLASLDRRVAEGEIVRPAATEEARLAQRKGDAHEIKHLAALQAAGRTIVDIPGGIGFEAARRAAQATLTALRSGVEVVHGATFVDVPAVGAAWLGVADFLVRVPGDSTFGAYRYEIQDAKLARTSKPSAIVQMCLYGDLLARAQGCFPEAMHLILGDGRIESFASRDVMAYYRAVRARFVRAMAIEENTYPDVVAHCGRCRFASACASRRRADDHLSLVAGMRRSQTVKLHAGGIFTVEQLAPARDAQRPPKFERAAFGRLRAQAALQVAARRTGAPLYELLPLESERGFARLPAPNAGDVYFDMEGDPFHDGGNLEYLFGAAFDERGEARFVSFDGHDRAAEKRAFEAFVDFVVARRHTYPKLHVYHYAAYEATALRRLALQHGTREAEVDAFLRGRVLVDLYDIIRQSLRASFESYSLKKIEQFYRGPRSEDVTSAIASVVAYERYSETRDPRELAAIVAYNREDCFSTRDLHRWLLERKAQCESPGAAIIPWYDVVAPDDEPANMVGEPVVLAADVPDILLHLVRYHRREAKPAWWAFFDRLERRTAAELVDDAEAIGDLTAVDGEPELFKRSQIFTFDFPVQEHKLKPGRVYDPALGAQRSAGVLLAVDDDLGRLRLSRGPGLGDAPLPKALCGPGPIDDDAQRAALARFARTYAKDRGQTHYRAATDLLHADVPRVRGVAAGGTLDDGDTTPDKLAALVMRLDESYLFVQGPPGAGKTWLGARAIVTLIAKGFRIGVAAGSHKAIHNLLEEIERVAVARGVAFRGLKKSSKSNSESRYASASGAIENVDETSPCANDRSAALVAGTAWLFADAQMDATLDVLVIDEAGQVALADAIAMATSARNVVLLGDPMQLAQVSQSQHPAGAGASVLEHLLGDRMTVSAERGVFLPRTFRMHEAVCSFVSALAYDGRLRADASCAKRRIDAGAIEGVGLRYLPVGHEGNVQQSVEEADAIADAIVELLGGRVTDETGFARMLDAADILVVTPYNAHVRRLRRTFDARGLSRIRVGTVDKFQGREASVVFFSLAASRGDEVPRGVDFVFDRNRLNVAISRARVLAVLVASPALLETAASTVEQLRATDALLRFVEEAGPLRGGAASIPEQLALLV